MFTFGCNQGDAPEKVASKPAAADWTQLVRNNTQLCKESEKETVYDQCNAVLSNLQDKDAKDFVKALVFLTTRDSSGMQSQAHSRIDP